MSDQTDGPSKYPLSFALWPFRAQPSLDGWDEVPLVPEEHPLLETFADDAADQAKSAYQGTMQAIDRCHQSLLLAIALLSLLLANPGELKATPIFSLVLLFLAVCVLLKVRIPFDKPIGVDWAFTARALADGEAGQNWRAKCSHYLVDRHHLIQQAVGYHLAIALVLIGVALFAWTRAFFR